MSSSRLAIAQGLVALLQTVTNPATSQPLYQAVQLGAFNESQAQILSTYASWAEVNFFEARGGPSGSGNQAVGWRIRETVTFSIVSGWDYEVDSNAAMVNMFTAQDILLPILRSHVTLPLASNPSTMIASVWLQLEEMPDRAVPVKFPNGHVYLLWHVYASVRQEYNVTIQNP
jgi:hypothetical protein